MSIGRICVREVDTASPDESIYLIAERMHQRSVGALVVVNDDSEPIGIVTDRDLMARVLAKGLDSTETVVRDVMTPAPTMISEDGAIESALALMRAGRFRRLPVVDGEKKLVGVISLDDILMLLAEECKQVGQLLERQTPRCVATGS